ncbi:MAG: tyrosine-type recombinase/integrase [Nitrospirota bacterium]
MRQRKKYDGLFLRGKIWWMSFVINGRQYRESTETEDRKLAEIVRAKVLVEIAENRWFPRKQAEKKGWSDIVILMNDNMEQREPKTQIFYKQRLAYLDNYFKGHKLAQIDRTAIQDYLTQRRRDAAEDKKRCSGTTLNRELAILSKMFNLAIKQGWIDSNPCFGIERYKEPKDIGQHLSEEDEPKLLEAAKPYLNGDLIDMVILAIYTGIRKGQVISLHWDKIDLDGKRFETYNEKTNEWYVLPMAEMVYQMLLRRSESRKTGYVFQTAAGTQYDGMNVLHWFQRACKDAKLPKMRFHDLRHTTGSRLARLGCDIHFISGVLNHSQLSTTRRYAKHNVASLQKGLDLLTQKQPN